MSEPMLLAHSTAVEDVAVPGRYCEANEVRVWDGDDGPMAVVESKGYIFELVTKTEVRRERDD